MYQTCLLHFLSYLHFIYIIMYRHVLCPIWHTLTKQYNLHITSSLSKYSLPRGSKPKVIQVYYDLQYMNISMLLYVYISLLMY